MRKEKAKVRQGTDEAGAIAGNPNCGLVIADGGLGSESESAVGNPKSVIVSLLSVGVIALAVLAASSVGKETARNDEEVPAFDEYLVIPERNMFSSRRRARQKEGKATQVQRSVATAALASIEVIGIVKTSDPLSSIAIIKDQGRHLPCRVGDRVGGMVITEIRMSEIFFETPGGTRIAKIQPPRARDHVVMPQSPRTAPNRIPAYASLVSGSVRRVPINAMAIKHLARKLPLVTETESGQVKGLRLTADAMGLREGDRVTHVGGQSLTTKYAKQKLLQITRKYRQYGKELPEIPVVVERDDKTLEFVLVPFS